MSPGAGRVGRLSLPGVPNGGRTGRPAGGGGYRSLPDLLDPASLQRPAPSRYAFFGGAAFLAGAFLAGAFFAGAFFAGAFFAAATPALT
jgi:hypothetical protein